MNSSSMSQNLNLVRLVLRGSDGKIKPLTRSHFVFHFYSVNLCLNSACKRVWLKGNSDNWYANESPKNRHHKLENEKGEDNNQHVKKIYLRNPVVKAAVERSNWNVLFGCPFRMYDPSSYGVNLIKSRIDITVFNSLPQHPEVVINGLTLPLYFKTEPDFQL